MAGAGGRLLRGLGASWRARAGRGIAGAVAAAGAAGAAGFSGAEGLPAAPQAERRPHELRAHGDVREDPYYWLRDDARESPAVLAHVGAENAYTAAVMRSTEALQDDLYREMRGRIQEADQTTPQAEGPFWYYSRTEEGLQYQVHCRRGGAPAAGAYSVTSRMDAEGAAHPEEVLLDENAEAAKLGPEAYYAVRGCIPSEDHSLLAYAEDTSGNEKYTLKVKDLRTGALVGEPVPETSGGLQWANDNRTLFYVKKDPLDRPFQVWRHTVGAPPESDALVYEEKDEAFYVGLSKSRSRRAIFIDSGSAVTSETLFLDADAPEVPPVTVLPRRQGVEYSVYHRGDHFIVESRDDAKPNSEVLSVPVGAAGASSPAVLVPHDPETKIEGLVVSQDHLAVFLRRGGLQGIHTYELAADAPAGPGGLGAPQELAFPEETFEIYGGTPGPFASPVLRFGYSSLSTPSTVYDHDMRTGAREVKKVQPVLGGFDARRYATKRVWATVSDGVRVPISLVWNRELMPDLDGTAPVLLDGYGSYEACNDDYFSSARLSLLDRGFVFANTHIRGGGEMGRLWYEDGKYLKKKNTVTDFVACAEHLVSTGVCDPRKVCIVGRSAGGITVGGAINFRPSLFCAAIAGVPFVDVVTTMMDETIPLTVIEWEEWGNPVKFPEFYHYMKSYSPYDNVESKGYPHLLVTAGLHDPRVGYWEPAKWVAKLRAEKTDSNMLLFKCDLGAGHFSKSGRFDRLKEVALEYAFLLKAVEAGPTHQDPWGARSLEAGTGDGRALAVQSKL